MLHVREQKIVMHVKIVSIASTALKMVVLAVFVKSNVLFNLFCQRQPALI